MSQAKDNKAKNPLGITDTTFRDAHQSLAATRMLTSEMEPIAGEMDKIGFHSVEVWGGATFDVTTRFLFEDPWERVEALKKLMPNTPFQMLLRGQNLVGYRNYPDDVVKAFVKESAEVGIDVFRIFDAVNDERNFEVPMQEVRKNGKHAQACICYSVTEEGHMGGPVYNLDYFVKKALTLEKMGADSICVKDMAGLLAPYDAYELVTGLKKVIKIPIQLHTHYTSGMAAMTAMKTSEAGIDVVDTCLSPLALRTSQPACETLVHSLRGTDRDTGLDISKLIGLGEYIETLAPRLKSFFADEKLAVVDTNVLSHQIPGGMASNLISQLKEADALDRYDEVLEELPRTRKELGYPPLVTPTSQIIGTMAVNNVLFGRYKMVPAQIKDYVYGLYGQPAMPMDQKVAKLVLKGYERGEKPVKGRPADYLEPEMKKAEADVKGLAKNMRDVLIYALYPVTGLKFLKIKYGIEEKPEEDIAKPKNLEASSKSSEAFEKSAKARDFNVFVGDESFQVTVDPLGTNAPKVSQTYSRPKASDTKGKSDSGQAASPNKKDSVAEKIDGTAIESPMPGIIIRYDAEVGAKVKAGDSVVVLEAMKMENALPAPVDGTVKALNFKSGDKVAKGDILAVIG